MIDFLLPYYLMFKKIISSEVLVQSRDNYLLLKALIMNFRNTRSNDSSMQYSTKAQLLHNNNTKIYKLLMDIYVFSQA